MEGCGGGVRFEDTPPQLPSPPGVASDETPPPPENSQSADRPKPGGQPGQGEREREWGAAAGRRTQEVIGHKSRPLYCLCPYVAPVSGCQGVSGNVERRDVVR